MSIRKRLHHLRRRDADGGYSVLEAAIVLPIEAAAQEGLRTTENYQATAAQGHADTITYLSQVAPHSLPNPQVTVTRSAQAATVTVTVNVASVIPFGHFTVTETASGPVENYVDAP